MKKLLILDRNVDLSQFKWDSYSEVLVLHDHDWVFPTNVTVRNFPAEIDTSTSIYKELAFEFTRLFSRYLRETGRDCNLDGQSLELIPISEMSNFFREDWLSKYFIKFCSVGLLKAGQLGDSACVQIFSNDPWFSELIEYFDIKDIEVDIELPRKYRRDFPNRLESIVNLFSFFGKFTLQVFFLLFSSALVFRSRSRAVDKISQSEQYFFKHRHVGKFEIGRLIEQGQVFSRLEESALLSGACLFSLRVFPRSRYRYFKYRSNGGIRILNNSIDIDVDILHTLKGVIATAKIVFLSYLNIFKTSFYQRNSCFGFKRDIFEKVVRDVGSPTFFETILLYITFKDLWSDSLSPRHKIFLPLECQVWEKALYAAISSNDDAVETYGYIHTVIRPCDLRYFRFVLVEAQYKPRVILSASRSGLSFFKRHGDHVIAVVESTRYNTPLVPPVRRNKVTSARELCRFGIFGEYSEEVTAKIVAIVESFVSVQVSWRVSVIKTHPSSGSLRNLSRAPLKRNPIEELTDLFDIAVCGCVSSVSTELAGQGVPVLLYVPLGSLNFCVDRRLPSFHDLFSFNQALVCLLRDRNSEVYPSLYIRSQGIEKWRSLCSD